MVLEVLGEILPLLDLYKYVEVFFVPVHPVVFGVFYNGAFLLGGTAGTCPAMEQQQAMKYALMRHGVLKAVRCASAPATLVTTASADRGVVNAILAKLDGAGLSVLSATPGARVDAVPPKSVLHLVHESVRTSQEAADVRGGWVNMTDRLLLLLLLFLNKLASGLVYAVKE